VFVTVASADIAPEGLVAAKALEKYFPLAGVALTVNE